MIEQSNLNHFDIGYAALWDKSDEDLISKYFNRISSISREIKLDNVNLFLAQTHPESTEGLLCADIINDMKIKKQKKSLLVKDFELQLERYYNDQTTELEPLEVNRQVDRVVNSGMGRIAEFIVGESIQFFNHYACGTSTTPAYASDTALISEHARISIESAGYATASGAVIKFGAYFPSTIASANVTEAGVFDDAIAGTLLFRVVYPAGKTINHVQNATFFSLSHAIYQSST